MGKVPVRDTFGGKILNGGGTYSLLRTGGEFNLYVST